MARTLKGTRIRGLPPKVLLSQRQDATGSFPTVRRTSVDNRTGKYNVFFNDNKVIPFSQPVTDVGFSVETYPAYEEKVITVGSLGNPVFEVNVTFLYAFADIPIVVLTELTNNPNTPIVNAYIYSIDATSMTIGFSAPFEGTVVYRALYNPSGAPVNVVRSPRYTDQYALVVAEDNLLNGDNILIPFSDFGSVPTSNYVTFWDYSNPPSTTVANMSASISSYISNTSVPITASAYGFYQAVANYMGFGTPTASIDVKGIVYPSMMTIEAINAGLSPEAIADLYKQPYFSGSFIVNKPILAFGSMKKGIADTFITFTPGQDVGPYYDIANPEVDGKISASVGGVNPFYATGSAVEVTGLGFQQPVWSKNKIEIPLDIDTQAVFGFYNNSSSIPNYPMAYYNFDTKTFDGIGNGRSLMEYVTGSTAQDFSCLFVSGCAGFAPGFSSYVGENGIFQNYNLARPVSTFGFPLAAKYNANSSQLLNIGDYISEPFLLEKIVIEFSASVLVSSSQDLTSPEFNGIQRNSITSFFILNQPGYNIFTPTTVNANWNSSIPNLEMDFTNPQNKYKDLVTYLQISSILRSDTGWGPANVTSSLRDLNFVKTASFGFDPAISWSGNYVMSGSSDGNVKSQIKNQKMMIVVGDGVNVSAGNKCTVGSQYSNRNMFDLQTGKDWNSSLETPIIAGITSEGPNGDIQYDRKNFNINPYILTPKDKLIFGWQIPFPKFFAYYRGINNKIEMTIPVQKMKVILYGSTLRFNPETNQLEEHHDTLNQLLNSDSIHEVIGE